MSEITSRRKEKKSRWSDHDSSDSGDKRKEREHDSRVQVDVEPSAPAPKKHCPINMGCRSLDLYEKLEKIGEGTYGAVYKARCRETNKLMALKKLKLESEKEGFPITSIRETITLLKGKHENVIGVKEIVFGTRLDHIYIVMEYMDRDLKSLMDDMKRPFKMAEVKLLMKQLISAVAHLHSNWILHRDLKTSNLLINKGVLKVGDFGLAREYGSPLKNYTSQVVTLWYRAPELLFVTGKYSTPIDIWSIGCIFGELLTKKPLFPGRSEMQQIELIFQALGAPTEILWPDFEEIRLTRRIERLPMHHRYNRLKEKLKQGEPGSQPIQLSDLGFDFWNRLLAYDPGVKTKADDKERKTHRITAAEALRHDFFKEEPTPINPNLFPTWPKRSSS